LSNCLIYALRKWWREGGYILIRWSTYYPGPHFLHMSRAGEITSFVPVDDKRRRLIPPPLFRGKIVKGDNLGRDTHKGC
jgi:hypothetical protein